MDLLYITPRCVDSEILSRPDCQVSAAGERNWRFLSYASRRGIDVGYFQLAQLLAIVHSWSPETSPCDHRCIRQLIMVVSRRCGFYSTARRMSILGLTLTGRHCKKLEVKILEPMVSPLLDLCSSTVRNANAWMQLTTPLHLASNYGRSDVACLLIEQGAEVEAKDSSLSRGRTTLQFASTE